jgi:Methyltransferase domain
MKSLTCPVCTHAADWLDVVDFNKSCEEPRGTYLPLSKIPIYYALCENCHFTFSPELYSWSHQQFEQYIYNEEYCLVDPDYKELRPKGNAALLKNIFSLAPPKLHLDYGGGNGMLSEIMKEAGWNSYTTDPYSQVNSKPAIKDQFNLITAFEVFEHSSDVNLLMKSLSELLSKDGAILFSTMLSDHHIKKNQRITWWYASPRNGHISLFSSKTLEFPGKSHGLNFMSFSPNIHVFYRKITPWSRPMFNYRF